MTPEQGWHAKSWSVPHFNNRGTFVGDVNIDFSDLSNVSVSTINYIDLMNDHNYQQLVKENFLYYTGEHCSLLDHVWTNVREMKVEVKDCPISHLFTSHHLYICRCEMCTLLAYLLRLARLYFYRMFFFYVMLKSY